MTTTPALPTLDSPGGQPAATRSQSTESTVQHGAGNVEASINRDKTSQVERINILVVGQPATGKTGLVKLFLETAPLSLQVGGPSDGRQQPESGSEHPGRLGDDPNPAALLARCAEFASFTSFCPTTALSTLEIPVKVQKSADGSPGTKTRILSFIDTPGLHLHLPHEREQVVDSILNRITEGFESGLKADTEIAARDNHIHLCLYLLDPNSVIPLETHRLLHPDLYNSSLAHARQRIHQATLPISATSHLLLAGMPERLSSPNEPLDTGTTTRYYDAEPTSPYSQMAILPEEKELIQQIARRVPVLPIIARADELTESRLEAIQECVKRELQGSTEALLKTLLEDSRTRSSADEPMMESAPRQQDRIAPAIMLPESYHHGDGAGRATTRPSKEAYAERFRAEVGEGWPLDENSIQDSRKDLVRSYRWGTINVLDAKCSDFLPLRTVLLHPRIRELRDLVMERYLPVYLADIQAPPSKETTVPRHRQEPSSGSSFAAPYSPLSLAHTPGLPPSPTAPFPQPRSRSSLTSHTTGPTRGTHQEEPAPVVSPALVTPSARSYPSRGSIQFAVPYSYKPSAPLPPGQASSSSSGFVGGPPVTTPSVPIRWADQTTPLGRRGSGKKLYVSGASSPVLTAPAPMQSTSNPVYQARLTAKSLMGNPEATLEQSASSGTSALTTGVPNVAPQTGSIYPAKSRTGRKIAVACNFCRSRKLKCDGVRPVCGQCSRRGVPCAYEMTVKKRGMGKMTLAATAVEAADSGDGSGVTPPTSSIPPASATETTRVLPSGSKQIQWRIDVRGSDPSTLTSVGNVGPALPGGTTESTQPQSPLAADLQAVLLSEIPSRGYACQFCRARKTRCDGTLPKCSNCAKRGQACVYPPSYFHAASASGEHIAFTSSSGSSDQQKPPTDPLQSSGSAATAVSNPTPRLGTSGVSLPPLSSLPLDQPLRERSSSSQSTSTSYWPGRAGNVSGTLLPSRQPPLSPLSTSRPFPSYGRSTDRGPDSRMATSSSRTSTLSRPPLLISTSPTAPALPPSGSNISPLTLSQSTPFAIPFPRRDSGEQQGPIGLMRRPSTAESASQSYTWRDRSSVSSSSTRGGGPYGMGGERKRKASGSEGGQDKEDEEDASAPSPPKRRRISGDEPSLIGERRSSNDETRK